MTAVAARRLRAARAVLIGLGAAVIAVGGAFLVLGVPLGQWGSILLWLAGAVVLHDAVLSPLLLVLLHVLRRVGRRTAAWALVAVQIALVTGGALALLAVPALRAQALGARNPSVLLLPYAGSLVVAEGIVLVIVAIALVAGRRVRS